MSEITVKSYRFEREKAILGGLEKAMDKVGLLIENEAKRNATNPRGGGKRPYVQSGLLSSNIGHTTKLEGDEIISIIGFSSDIPDQELVNYAYRVELGSTRQSPYPFLFPAVEAKRGEIIEILKGSVKEKPEGAMTWRKFTAGKMGEYMKSEGGHAGAMKRLGKEWGEYKASR